MTRLLEDIRRGWSAPGRDLMTGILATTGMSAPALVVLLVATPLGAGAATALVVPLQLGGCYAVAGRLARGRHGA